MVPYPDLKRCKYYTLILILIERFLYWLLIYVFGLYKEGNIVYIRSNSPWKWNAICKGIPFDCHWSLHKLKVKPIYKGQSIDIILKNVDLKKKIRKFSWVYNWYICWWDKYAILEIGLILFHRVKSSWCSIRSVNYNIHVGPYMSSSLAKCPIRSLSSTPWRI